MRTVFGFLLAAFFLPQMESLAAPVIIHPCTSTNCLVSAEFRASGAPSLLHQVNIFALDGVMADPRRRQSQTGEGKVYAPIGEILPDNPIPLNFRRTRTGRTQGTGFLIAPCLVLTNYHAVFGERLELPDAQEMSKTVTFIVAGRAAVRSAPVVVGRYYDDRNQDYVLLKLEPCWGADPDIGWLQLGPLAPGGQEQDVAMAGHPGGLDRNSLWIHDKCHLFANRNSFARLTNCANSPGASGSPLMFNDNGVLKVAAMIRSERNRTPGVLPAYDDAHANVAVDIYRILRHDPAAAKAIATNILHYYETVVKSEEVPDDLALCGRENLRVSEVQRCANAINWVSSKALAAASRDPKLAEDELRSIWLSAQP